jgi:hypothetical protein
MTLSFSGTPAVAAPDVTLTSDDGFYPAISTQDFVTRHNIPPALFEVINDHLLGAMACAHVTLMAWRTNQVRSGYHTLAAVPAEKTGPQQQPESVRVRWYRDAIYYLAMSSLLLVNQTLQQRAEAEHTAQTSPETEQRYHHRAHEALARIMAQSTRGVHLI